MVRKLDKTNLIFILLIILFILIKIPSLKHYTFGDENTYYYMSKLVANDLTPYKDFFYAHPPLHLFIFTLIFKLFGFNYIIFKLTSNVALIITAIFLFKLLKNELNNLYAITFAIIFLFSYDALRLSTFPNGMNFATMFLVIGFFYLFKKNYFVSGLFVGLASMTRLLALIPFIIIFVSILLFFKKKYLKFLIGFSLIFLIINIIFIAIFGQNYITPVYKYHLLKKPIEGRNNFDTISRVSLANFLLFIPSLLFIIFFFLFSIKKLKTKKIILVSFLIFITYFIFLLSIKQVFDHYFSIIMPFSAVLGSYTLIKIFKIVNKKFTIPFLIILIIISAVWSSINFLKYDFQNFDNAREIADYIKTSSKPNDKIFGDDSSVPLLALLSQRNIALNFADLNDIMFTSGIVDSKETIKKLKEKGLKFFIVYKINYGKFTGTFGLAKLDEFNNFIKESCRLDKTFKQKWSNSIKIIEVWNCKK